jgi:hypothetical protein
MFADGDDFYSQMVPKTKFTAASIPHALFDSLNLYSDGLLHTL